MKTGYVYIVTNRPRGVLYTGVTHDLHRRMYEHKNGVLEGFSKKYNTDKLVWFAQGPSMEGAITLEKKIKNRGRRWKMDLIERENPEWADLAARWFE